MEAALERAVLASEDRGSLLRTAVISQLHPDMRASLGAELRFNHHLRQPGGDS